MKEGFLRGFLMALFLFVAKGLVYLGYGKKGMEAQKDLAISTGGITFVWYSYLVILSLIIMLTGLFEDPMTALLIFIGGAIPYILWLIRARRSVPDLLRQVESLKKGMEAERSSFFTSREEEAKKKAEMEAQRARQEAEMARKEETKRREMDARRQQLFQDGIPGGFADFVEVASGCKKVTDIQAAWNVCPKEGIDQTLQHEVQKRLDRLGSQEMIFGTSERRTNELIMELKGLAGQ